MANPIQMTAPPHHRWVETEDGSKTLFSEKFQEACHSSSGAKAETLLHYIQGCKVKEKLQSKERISILEVGFGLGIGFLATFEALASFNKPYSFLSLEIDPELLEWFRLQQVDHPFLRDLHWVNEHGLKILRAKNELIELNVLCGDARQTLPTFGQQFQPKWDAIYQDAFSPKRNPVLWTREWFTFLKTHSRADVLLSTYSASTSIRKSLVESGWILQKGEKFGPKRTSTRASLQGSSDPDILLHLERSPTPALCDDNLKSFLSK